MTFGTQCENTLSLILYVYGNIKCISCICAYGPAWFLCPLKILLLLSEVNFFYFIGKHVPWRIIHRIKKWKMEGSSNTGLLPTPARPVFQYVSE